MSKLCEVAIIGAGPYGLSLAAHLSALGVGFRIFGKPMSTWREHMPKDMLLKSEGFASSLSSPDPESTLKAYCTKRGIPYADRGLPVPLDVFVSYAQSFIERYVPNLEAKNVIKLERAPNGFSLTLEDGAQVQAKNVVMAVGIHGFQQMPEMLANLPAGMASHSFDHREGAPFKDKDVVVLGAGASATDLAALLHDCGAKVSLVARDSTIRFHDPAKPEDEYLTAKIKKPPTTIGPGWRSWFCVHTPQLFRLMPEQFRLRATKNHLGPAPGWFVKKRVDGVVPAFLGFTLRNAEMRGRRAALHFTDSLGAVKTLEVDHVIAATGYKPDLRRLPFLSAELRNAMQSVDNTPILSRNFESSVPGLFVIGPAAANSFGPLMRFATGATFAAPQVAARLRRKTRQSPAWSWAIRAPAAENAPAV